jgi:hypothetical protein
VRESGANASLYSFRMDAFYRQRADRRPGLLLTVLVHVALVLGWQALRTLPAPAEDGAERRILWIPLPPPLPAPRDREPPPRKETEPPRPLRRPGPALTLPPAPVPEADPAPAQPAANRPTAEQILERARRDIGRIDKALRKENNPYIAAPLDSPQIRMRKGMEQAAALAPNRIWEAPKVEELVNNTGDGARRTRVVGALGTYCVTERAPTTSIDMIEKHGKLRITNCPRHETPASRQEWRTLRD